MWTKIIFVIFSDNVKTECAHYETGNILDEVYSISLSVVEMTTLSRTMWYEQEEKHKKIKLLLLWGIESLRWFVITYNPA